MPNTKRAKRELSTREREVAALIAAGKSNRAISEALFLSERTVEHHVSAILNKLGVNTRAELMALMLAPASPPAEPPAVNVAAQPRRGVFSRSMNAATATSSRVFSRLRARLRRTPSVLKDRRTHAGRVREVLPHPPTETIGREADVERVVGEIATARLVTITGPGGVGKTRVAIEAGLVMRARGTVCVFVDLATATTDADVLAAVLTACGGNRIEAADALAALIALLANHKVLLILDNCEHVATQVAGLVRAVMAGAPSIKLVITSRRVIGIPGERVVRLEPLPLAPTGASHDQVLASPAVRLFASRARDCSGLVLDAPSLGATVELCAMLDGLPLALEFAAGKTAALSVKQIVALARDRASFLTIEAPAAPRQKSLHALIDWSYALLTPQEQRLFRAVSAFPEPWTIDDVAGLLASEPAPAVADGVVALTNHSLISRFDQDGKPRFRMLETVRAFATQCARNSL